MSKDYVADNAGTGFASFDDDGPSDLDSLLAGAALGEEEDDQDTASYFNDEEPAVYTSQSKGLGSSPLNLKHAYEKEEPRHAAPVAPALIADEEEYDDLPEAEPATYEEPVYAAPTGKRSWEMDPNPTFSPHSPQPDAAPVSATTPATSSWEPAPASARKIHVPSELDEIALASKVIRILDAYRKLSSEVRTVASQFITNGDEVINDEATLVIKVINVDPMLSVTMRALREAKSLDPVERVFYVISLEDDVLHSLGGLVSVFNGNAIDSALGKINYARALVREIDKLEPRAVNYIESTESILSAADGESN